MNCLVQLALLVLAIGSRWPVLSAEEKSKVTSFSKGNVLPPRSYYLKTEEWLDRLEEMIRTSKPTRPIKPSKRLSKMKLCKTSDVLYEDNLYGGGWIVIQHRFNGSVDFFRNWNEYRDGFGSLDGEFWFGLENIHLLTSSANYELLVHLESFDGVTKYARYIKFAIGGEHESYKLKTLEYYSGTAGDSLKFHKGQKFSTYDRDNDIDTRNCAKTFNSAWWYADCAQSDLNAIYENSTAKMVMAWYTFYNEFRGFKTSMMMIKQW